MEHAFDVKYTKEEIEKILKELDKYNKKNAEHNRNTTPPRSKI